MKEQKQQRHAGETDGQREVRLQHMREQQQ